MGDDHRADVMSRFVELFLQGDSLQRVLRYLCDTSSGKVVDPITDVVCIMITSPLQLVITEVGVAPFRDRPAHVYPYTEMGAEQRGFLREIVQHHLDCSHGSYINAASTQMGGGFVVEFQTSAGRGDSGRTERVKERALDSAAEADSGGARYLDAESVVKTMCRAVFRSRTHMEPWRKHGVCSILIQRVASAVHMPRGALQRVGDEISRLEAEDALL